VSLPLMMVAVVGMFAWEFPVTLPLLAERVFGGGPRSYGFMVGVMGAGAVLGGLLTPTRTAGLPNLPMTCILWGIPILLTAFAPTFPVAIACLLLVGYGSISFNAMSKTTLQLGASPEMRGRVMALWGIAWQGSTPVGGPVAGLIGQQVGARWALATGGFAALAVGASTLVPWRAVRAAARPASQQNEPIPSPSASVQ
jgi:MFS family permease